MCIVFSSYKDIKEEVTNATDQYVFIKEMAYELDSFRSSLPEGLKHTFLIRDPSRCFASYRKGLAKRYSGILQSRDFDIVQNDIMNVKPMSWYETQYKFWRDVKDDLDPHPVVIDAYDLLSQPGPTLRAYCEAVGFPYTDDLLQWEAGPALPKNMEVWTPDLYANLSEFHSNALNTTHFMAPLESGPIPRDQLTDDVIRCVDHSMPFYREMYESRLKV